MAEQIRQEFVIDAADALRDLETLMTRFKKLNDQLGSYTRTATEFNRSAGKVVRALTKIKEEAKGAADQLARVSRNKGIVPRAAPKAATTTTTGVDPKKTKQAAASLEQLRAAAAKVFSGAAIQNQKQFQAALNELVAGFHRTGGTVDEFKEKVRKLDERMNGSKARMTAAMRAIGKSAKQNLNPKPLLNFTVSWKTMIRIVTTQLIVRALNAIRQAMIEAVKGSIEFQRSIAEIGTIANDAYGSLGDIAKIVRETSDEFGKGRIDVAEGLYQTLSNQVGDATESLHVFRTANKLSIAAVSSTEDAVNLLTAALNSFDISTSRSEEVAAKLFKTVELGRTRVSELANTFGRIGPLAHSLGISLEETLAAIATITVQGTRTAESMTQVRGVMQALLKPSDNLKKSFQEMGVANAEQLIATYGFQGALKELQKTTGTSSSEMGKLIRRVRGLLGAITLASQDAETFVNNLTQIEEVSAELLDTKYKLVFETPGEELAREFNKLKNILVEDIGRALVNVTLKLFDWGKAVASVGSVVKDYSLLIATVLLPLYIKQITALGGVAWGWTVAGAKAVASAAAQAAAAGVATVAAEAAAAAWLALAGPFAAAIVLIAATTYHLRKTQKAYQDAVEGAKELVTAHYKLERAIANDVIEKRYLIQQKLNDLHTSDTLKVLAAVEQAYNKQAAIVAETNKKEVESTKDKFKDILSALEDYQSAYEDAATEAADAIVESQDRIYDINKSGEEDKYKRSLRYLDSQDTVYAQQKRILALNREAQSLLVTGKPKDIERALALYGDAEKIYGNLNDLAWKQLEPLEKAYKAGTLSRDRMGDLAKARQADNRAQQLGNNLTNARIAAEKKLQAVEQEKQRIAEQRAETLKTLNSQFQSEFDIIFDNMDQFDKDNKRLDADALKAQSLARARAFASIRDLAKELPEFDYQDFFGLAQLSSELDGMLSDKEMTIAEESINQMGAAIAKGFSDYMGPEMEARIKAMSKTFGVEFDRTRGVGDLSEAVFETNKTAEQLGKVKSQLDQQRDSAQKLAEEYNQLASIANTTEVPFWGGGAFDRAGTLINKMADGYDLSIAESVELRQEMDKVLAAWDGLGDRSKIAHGNLTSLVQKVQELRRAQTKVEETQKAYTELSGETSLVDIQKALQLSAEGQVDALSRIAPLRQTETTALGESKSLSETLLELDKQRATESKKAADNYKAAFDSLEATSRLSITKQQANESALEALGVPAVKKLGGLIQGYAKGGLVNQLSYLAKGNLARGTDTIPAMLSPGEFVMNSKSTRRFFSQLVAMNSGRSPIFRQDGGSVTNVTVGDVNINGGGVKQSAHQQGRQVVAAIKREMRRGTSSF